LLIFVPVAESVHSEWIQLPPSDEGSGHPEKGPEPIFHLQKCTGFEIFGTK
jgi:hypothetical protein